MLEQLAGDDDVEARVLERQAFLRVDPLRLDAQARRVVQRQLVDVDTDNVVPLQVRPRQRAVAAPDVEDAAAGASDVAAEELGALAASVDEGLRAVPMVPAIAPTLLLEPRHPAQCTGLCGPVPRTIFRSWPSLL